MKSGVMILVALSLSGQAMAGECYRTGSEYPANYEYETGSPVGTARRPTWEAVEERRVFWENDSISTAIPHDRDLAVTETLHPKKYLTKNFYQIQVSKPSGDRCVVVGTKQIYHPTASCLREKEERIEERERLRAGEAREKAECDSDIFAWRNQLEEYRRNPPRPPAKPACVEAEPERLRAIEAEKAVCNAEISTWRTKVDSYNSEKPACLATETTRDAKIATLKASCDAEIVRWNNTTPRTRPPECMGFNSELNQLKREDEACEPLKRAFIDRYGTYGSNVVPPAPRPPACMGQDSSRLAQLKSEQESCAYFKNIWQAKLDEYNRSPKEAPRPPICMNRPIDRRSERVYIPQCPDVAHTVDRYDWVGYEELTQQVSMGSTKELQEDRPIEVTLRVSGQVLRSFEAERLSVVVDENGYVDVKAYDGGYGTPRNKYEINARNISPRRAEAVVVGRGRRLGFDDGVKPSLAELLTQQPVVYTRNGDIWVEMTVNTDLMNKATDPNMRVKVTYQVQQTAGLEAYHTEYKPGQSGTQEFDVSLNGGKIRMNLAGAGRGRRVKAGIWINIMDSKWYSEGTYVTEATGTSVPR
ncbi:MAG: hypothetical protein K2X47_01255 [Bdellovibrionales bacterium]|nr:hypothetical protein [Bdellovibrionales bacterium]